jgi:hypothetical protein
MSNRFVSSLRVYVLMDSRTYTLTCTVCIVGWSTILYATVFYHYVLGLKCCEVLGVYMPIDTTFLGAAFAAPLA